MVFSMTQIRGFRQDFKQQFPDTSQMDPDKIQTNAGGMQEVFDFYFFQTIITDDDIKTERKIKTP